MAFRMQTAVPEITDMSKESESVIKLYGPGCAWYREHTPPIVYWSEII